MKGEWGSFTFLETFQNISKKKTITKVHDLVRHKLLLLACKFSELLLEDIHEFSLISRFATSHQPKIKEMEGLRVKKRERKEKERQSRGFSHREKMKHVSFACFFRRQKSFLFSCEGKERERERERKKKEI